MTIPASFTDQSKTTKICVHNLARPGTLRRPLGIPNPISQYNLCKTIETHWTTLDSHMRRSTLSRSIPVPGHWSNRALTQSTSRRGLLSLKAGSRARSRFVLRADISRFYPSIYSHSIPWAIHTKEYAKTNRRAPIVGNLIDAWVRNGQDGQTVGIPIGPDTSFLIAETILSAADHALTQKAGALNGIRYIDDYELGFATRAKAEEAMAILQETLAEFELALNPQKTGIIELPLTLLHPWTSELSSYSFRTSTKAQGTDIIRFFDRSFILAKESPGDPVLRYALARLKSVHIDSLNWSILEKLLYQCILLEPGTIIFTLEQLLHYHLLLGYPVDFSLLDHVLNQQIMLHGPLGHGSEVAWALWSLMSFNRPVSTDSVKVVSNMDDPVVALLALDALQRGLAPSGLNPGNWHSHMDVAGLYDEHWLLSYEANFKGWLPSVGGEDHVRADAGFNFLKQSRVYFYDAQRTLSAYPSRLSPYLG